MLTRLSFPALLLSLCAALPSPASSAQAAPDGLPPDSVRADLALLRGALTAYHPALGLGGRRAEMDTHLDSLDAALAARTEPVPPREAAALLARALAAVRDGHTRLNPLNQSATLQTRLWGGRTALPFAFRIVGEGEAERLVVTHDFSRAGALPPGTEVVRVDGLGVPRWLDRLQPLSPGDGYGTEALRRARLATAEADLTEDGWPLADVLSPLAFPDLPARATLLVHRPGADGTEQVVVERLSRTDRTRRLRDAGALAFEDERAWESRMLDEQTGYLRLGSFLSYLFSQPADSLLASRLRSLRAQGARRLVLDVRGVSGGTLGGERVARYLSRHTAPCLEERVEIASDRADPAFFPYLTSMGQGDGWKQPLPPGAVRPLGDGRFELLAAPGCSGGAAPDAAWAGPVVVLADAHNVSATFRLLRAVREHDLGAIVGEPAGGNLTGTAGGMFVLLRLPRTGLAVDLPLLAYRPAPQAAPGPLLPDVLVRWTAQDVALGRDPALNAALRWFEGSRE